MPSYLVEAYAADRARALDDAREHALRAAELSDDVRYVRTTFLPDDETILHAFEASSVEALREAAQLVALQYHRIVEAVEGTAADTGVTGA